MTTTLPRERYKTLQNVTYSNKTLPVSKNGKTKNKNGEILKFCINGFAIELEKRDEQVESWKDQYEKFF
jgi:hypothetical protein